MNGGRYRENLIVGFISRLMIPFIQLFGFYVIAHGDIGPGGGFQGGVILGASVILYVLAFGLEKAKRRYVRDVIDALNSTGVLIYASVGIACLLAGGAFLEYTKLPFGHALLASHLGIYFIEIGVGITVAAVMITIFFETARRKDD